MCRNARTIIVLSRREVRGKGERKPRGKTEWVMRGSQPCWRNQIVAALGAHLGTANGVLCSASLFLLDSVIKYGWARRARETLIWYLEGRGANINVRLPRAKLMPPRERFYVATTGPWAPHNAPAPYKANESRRVHGGRRSRQTGAAVTTGILTRKQRSSCTLIFYTHCLHCKTLARSLSNLRWIYSHLKSANRITPIAGIYHTSMTQTEILH